MPVGDFPFPHMNPVQGIRLGTASAAIKSPGRKDVMVMEVCEGATVAGVFTQNAFCAAPVTVSKEHLAKSPARYLLTNSGNANACTGDQGYQDAVDSCERIAELTGVDASQVLPFSTGVIGVNLPMDKLLNALPEALSNLSESGWQAAAEAIMTTDTRPKGAAATFEYQGATVRVNGIAKGSGMIRPDMATMLAYIATDATVAQPVLDQLLKEAVDSSFNRITVDGDTSTNDSCILAASGKSEAPEIISADGELYSLLRDAVIAVHKLLAQNIVADGEGATKFVTVAVQAAENREEALRVAYSVAQSPLIKTALFASDPNWGRIVAAIGYAGVKGLDDKQVKVWLDNVLIVENGGCAESYSEEAGQEVMNQEEITIRIDLGRGEVAETVWTTDLSHDYIKINAEYRT
ncbi:MAG: bifunctional glutamate N-acetyltransferase/amino-acid acetyltransferase ArgJ [Candidatus Pelagadaptatus aseana]|uniref:bifunctional glutamate N-acetyltransferase/amino-acid acetyltransferase ArgJ n=1 Tax=Candidatus Pelagadaptatus aseana TaxID=3120508 RepID=UPI0039B15FE8